MQYGGKERVMIISDGYSIEFFKNRNQIVITVPQTMETLTSTVAMVSNRRTYLTESEMTALLGVVKAIMERRE